MKPAFKLLLSVALIVVLAWIAFETVDHGVACDKHAVSLKGTVADCEARPWRN